MVKRIQVTRPIPIPESAGWLRRAARALFIERRVPYRAQIAIDDFCNAIGLKRKTVSAGGFRVAVRRRTCDEDFVRLVIVDNEYTPPGYEIGESDTVIDIGGNIGTFSLVAGRRANRGRVFSFEPDSENFGFLKRNLSLNHAGNVVPFMAAVGAGDGTMKLFRAGQGGFHTLLAEQARDGDTHEMVQVVSLKRVFDDNKIERCHFLKLDCEGAEYEILHGLPATYFTRLDKIVLEYHGPSLDVARARSARLAAHLESLGFDVTYEEFDGLACGFIRAKRPG